MTRIYMRWLAGVVVLSASFIARADTLTLPTLDVTGNTPSMDRPVPNGDLPPTTQLGVQVPYAFFEFYSTLGGQIDINLNAIPYPGLALMIFVYADVFDPASPLTNCIEGFGDITGAATRSLSFSASAHRRYVLVVTPFQSTRGTATGSIVSPGLLVPIRSHEATWLGGGPSSPIWNRPVANGNLPPNSLSGTGTAVPYLARRIWVSAAGRYTFFGDFTNADASFADGYIFVYNGSFAATSPLANVLIGNDDIGPNTGNCGLSVNLPAAGNYYVVTTTFGNQAIASLLPPHTVHVTGPGRIEPGPLCEADYNRSNLVSVQDIFDFIAAWFRGCN